MAALVEASALQPWAVLKAFAGGVARGEDTAFEWDPPDAPKSCTSWNEAVHGAEPLALLEGEARENFATAPKRPPAQFKSFRDFAIKLNSQERSNKRARPMLFVGGCHRSGTSVLARLLKRSPLVAGMEDTDAPEDEGQHLQHVLPTDEEHGGVGCFALDAKYRWTEATTDPDPVACGEQLLYSWGNWWLRSSRRRGRSARPGVVMRPLLLEKTPSNIVHTRRLPGRGRGDSTSLRRECFARARSGKRIPRALRGTIARPKISRHEWTTTERGAFGKFARSSRAGGSGARSAPRRGSSSSCATRWPARWRRASSSRSSNRRRRRCARA
jgi:hypothetical protein